jgi:integrase
MSYANELDKKSIATNGSQKTAIYALLLFKRFTNQSHLEIINQVKKGKLKRRQVEKIILRYYTWLMNQRALSKNTAYIYSMRVKKIFSNHNISLELKQVKRGESIPDWIPSLDQLKEMYNIASLDEKILIYLACTIPFRIGDFINLRKDEVINAITKPEFPKFFAKNNNKGNFVPCFISFEADRLLKKYLPTLRSSNPYLFQGRASKSLSEDSINRKLKILAKKSGMDTRGLKIRFRLFRKLFIYISRDMIGLSVDQIKIFLGKNVEGKLTREYMLKELKPAFVKIVKSLNLGNYSQEYKIGFDQISSNTELITEVLAVHLRDRLREELSSKTNLLPDLGLSKDFNLKKLSSVELLKLYLTIFK